MCLLWIYTEAVEMCDIHGRKNGRKHRFDSRRKDTPETLFSSLDIPSSVGKITPCRLSVHDFSEWSPNSAGLRQRSMARAGPGGFQGESRVVHQLGVGDSITRP